MRFLQLARRYYNISYFNCQKTMGKTNSNPRYTRIDCCLLFSEALLILPFLPLLGTKLFTRGKYFTITYPHVMIRLSRGTGHLTSRNGLIIVPILPFRRWKGEGEEIQKEKRYWQNVICSVCYLESRISIDNKYYCKFNLR